MPSSYQFYYREGCHLCEQMVALIHAHWPEQIENIEWCDVDTRKEWFDQFDQRVPVLLQNEQLIAEFTADLAQLSAYFGVPVKQV